MCSLQDEIVKYGIILDLILLNTGNNLLGQMHGTYMPWTLEFILL